MRPDQRKSIKSLLKRMESLLLAKGHDYSGTEDTLSNFKQLRDMGISPPVSVFVRLTDKHQRIKHFLKTGVTKVSTEKIEDTAIDLANYSLLLILALQECHITTCTKEGCPLTRPHEHGIHKITLR